MRKIPNINTHIFKQPNLPWLQIGIIDILLPVFGEPVLGPLQHLFTNLRLPEVKVDGFTYVKDEANTGTDRLQLTGKSLAFDGVDGKITIPHSDSLTFGNGTVDQPFSISGWINTTDLVSVSSIFAQNELIPDDREYLMFLNAGILSLQLYDNVVANRITGASTNKITSGVDVFFIASYDGSGSETGINAQFYESGISSGGATIQSENGTYVAMHGDATDYLIGAYDGGFSDLDIWDARVHNAELTQAEIDLLVANPNALTGHEVGMWHLDEGAGLTAFDSSGNGQHGTISGGVSQSTQDVVSFQNYGGYSEGLDLGLVNSVATISPSQPFLQNEGDYTEINFKSTTSSFVFPIDASKSNTGLYFRETGFHSIYYNGVNLQTNTTISIEEIVKIRVERNASNCTIILTQSNGTVASYANSYNETDAVFDAFTNIFGQELKEIIRSINVNGTVYNAENDWNGITWTGGTQTDVLIPAQTSTLDVFGEALTYSGKAPKDGKIVESIIPIFDGVADEVNFGDCGSTTKVSLYVRSVVDNQYILSLDNLTTKAVYVSAGVLTFGASLTASNITIDGVVKTPTEAGVLLNDNLIHLLEFDLVSVTCTDVRLARSVANYGNIEVCKFELDELFAPMAECAGLINYDSLGNSDGTIVGTESAIWASNQDLYHYNLLNGYSLYEHATTNLIRVPYQLSITPPTGYTLTEDRPSGKWHNGAETKVNTNFTPDPELIYRGEIPQDNLIHNSDTFTRPEFIDKNNLAKTTDYIVYDKNITTEQGNEVDDLLGN